MARILLALAVLLGLAAGSAAAQSAAGPEDAAIERVIADQLAAFQRDDMGAAFSHAAPGIRAKFGSAENFGRMVRQGYPMIYRPSRVEWRGLRAMPTGQQAKTVLFEDSLGRIYEAEYLMGLKDGVWRIMGVQLKKLPGVAS